MPKGEEKTPTPEQKVATAVGGGEKPGKDEKKPVAVDPETGEDEQKERIKKRTGGG